MSVLILSKKTEGEYENRRLITSLSDLEIPATIYYPDNFDVIVGKGIGHGIKYNGNSFDMPNLVLPRSGSGTTEFITALLRQFEEKQVTCINSSLSVEIAKDKMRSHQLLASRGLPIPNTMLVRFPVDSDIVDNVIGWPCVVKVISGSHGEGIYLCENKKTFVKIMEFVGSLDSPKTLIVQEYVDSKPGEDLRVFVVGGKVIGAMKRHAPKGDFRANISAGGHGEPFEVDTQIDFLARETARICGLDIAGIDLLFDKDGYKICEANSAPGFEGFEKYCNVDVAKQIAEYIKYKITLGMCK
jgi:gamma-F420-2:alpha-L-glutamate ligase